MAKRKKSQKTIIKEKKAVLSKIAKAEKTPILDDSQILEEKILSDLKFLREKYAGSGTLKKDESYFRTEKSELLREIDSFKDPEILEMPDFLLDPSKEEERKAVIERLRYLLKRRFSLITIADCLETNDYSKLDEVIKRKDETYRVVDKYTTEESDQPVRLLTGFKRVVGDEYAEIYAEQEKKVKAALEILYEGKYFIEAESKGEDIISYIEDIIGNIIDSPDFNLACQIEAEFVGNEMERASTILSELASREELRKTIDELLDVTRTIEERGHAYSVIDRLMTGEERKKIANRDSNKEEGER